jgi:hypothetical protein
MILAAVIFVTLGLLIKNGKFYGLIAGYNTMSQEDKAKYNIEKIATLFRNVMFSMAAIVVIGYVFSIWLENEKIAFYAVIAATLSGIPYLLIKSNSKTYKNPSNKN